MKSLTKSPADRWQKIEDFGQALSMDPTSPSIRTQAVVLEKKKKWYGWAIAGTTIAAVAGAAALYAYSTRDNVQRGRDAFERWNLPEAQSAFEKAVSKNEEDPAANLWLGQTLLVKGAPMSEWSPYILRARDGKASLSADDAGRADALAMLLTQPFFQTFTQRPLTHPTKQTEGIYSLAVNSRDEQVIAKHKKEAAAPVH